MSTGQQILAPVQLLDIRVNDIALHVADEPADEMQLKANIKMLSFHFSEEEIASEYRATVQLLVEISLVNADEQSDTRVQAHMRDTALVAVSKDIVPDEERAYKYLQENGVSMAYSHARSCIMTISALSPMGAFIIPPILPSSLINTETEEQ